MEALGVRVLIAPSTSVAVMLAIAAGIGTGTCSGLLPGLHVNNLAMIMAAVGPGLPVPPHLLGATMVTAGIVHSFLDVVPSLALGVPDAEMAAAALPGHRLVLAGRGPEALRLSVLGSAGAVAIALPLALPLTALMQALYPKIEPHVGVLVIGIAGLLVLSESHRLAAIGGVCAVTASGALGVVTLTWLEIEGPLSIGGPLTPLFAGLFGAPILIDAASGRGVPLQSEDRLAITPTDGGLAALAGSVAGALVAYIPGVSAAVGAVIALGATPTDGDRGYLIATSGANTSNAVFALFALVALGTPRTGVMVAVEDAAVPLNLPLLLAGVVIGAGVGALLVLVFGERYLAVVGTLDPRYVSGAVLGLLVCLSGAFAGGLGIAIFGVASAVGRIPQHFGARRVHLMAVLYPAILLPL